jgi:tRNA(Ile)-lysidine synthase
MLPVKHFTDFIEQNTLFDRSGKILAAVSGGMDSVVMVHLLKSAGFNFGIAHCNFQLRGDESVLDQQFCNNLAKRLGVHFHTICFDTLKHAHDEKISTQMAARRLRYEWFEQLRQQLGYNVIALAHHQNDAIETILLNLTRGTTIAGMHGILPKNGTLVRPLLFLKREDIETIITENGLAYVEDSSNASVKYARNKIRLEVIPKLKELNPALEHTFENNLAHFRELELFLERQVYELKKQLFIPSGEEFHLPLKEIRELAPKRLLLFKLLQPYGFNESTVDDLIRALDTHPGRIFETPYHRLILDRENLVLTRRDDHPHKTTLVKKNDREVNHGDYKLSVLHDDSALIVKDNPMAVSIDSGALIYPLTLRPWHRGDYFYPLGMKAKKKISDFFVDRKLPLHKKNEIPLLVNGNGDIMWIGGYRPDERYKVTANTKKVTIFELINLKMR